MTQVMKFLLTVISLVILSTNNCFAYSHDGKEPMEKKYLESCIRLGICCTGYNITSDRVALLMETAAVESRLGKYDVPYKAKGSLGIFQICPSTAKDSLNWLKRKSLSDWTKLTEGIYDSTLSFNKNLETNVEFSAAIAWLVYARLAYNNDMENRTKRAAIWKKYYNTKLGKGTEENYLKVANELLGSEEI